MFCDIEDMPEQQNRPVKQYLVRKISNNTTCNGEPRKASSAQEVSEAAKEQTDYTIVVASQV